MPAPVVTLVDGNDWEGLFVDGQVIEQTHNIRAWHVLKALAKCGLIEFVELHANEANLETSGSFADTLDQNRKEGIIE